MHAIVRRSLLCVAAVVPLAAALPTAAARFQLPPGSTASKHFGVPKRVQLAIQNLGDCSARILGQDPTGRLFFADDLAPGETTVYESPTQLAFASVQVGIEGPIGAVLVATAAAPGQTYRHETPDGTLGCNGEEVDIYVQFDTCPPTLSPVITVKNLNDDCDIEVIAATVAGPRWGEPVDEVRFRLSNGQRTPPFQGLVRKWKVRCVAMPRPQDLCRFEWTL